MNKLYIISMLVISTVCTANVYADTTTMQVDPTLQFFTSLSTCAVGNYTEANSLSAEVGPQWLNQQIMGQDKNGCNVQLTTADNRTLQCTFPMAALTTFNDQHFLQGMLDNNVRDPSKDSLTADFQWSKLKSDDCSFSN